MFKGKENHLNLIQEVRTENALQKEEQELLQADRELIKTLTEQRDSSLHQVKQTDASVFELNANFIKTEHAFFSSLHTGRAGGGVSGGGGGRRARAPV